MHTTYYEVFLLEFDMENKCKCSSKCHQLAFGFILKMKRKGECLDSSQQEAKRRKKLEDAKKFIEKSGATIKEAAIQFGVD